jgi:hypothetical protein
VRYPARAKPQPLITTAAGADERRSEPTICASRSEDSHPDWLCEAVIVLATDAHTPRRPQRQHALRHGIAYSWRATPRAASGSESTKALNPASTSCGSVTSTPRRPAWRVIVQHARSRKPGIGRDVVGRRLGLADGVPILAPRTPPRSPLPTGSLPMGVAGETPAAGHLLATPAGAQPTHLAPSSSNERHRERFAGIRPEQTDPEPLRNKGFRASGPKDFNPGRDSLGTSADSSPS